MKRKTGNWRMALIPLVSPQRIQASMSYMEPLVRKNLTR